MDNRNENLPIDYDSNWKWLIERHPQPFIQFFLPSVYPLVDFAFRPRLAKQDILKIAGANKKKGNMVADCIQKSA